MPTRLLLEGANLEALLDRVRTEHGPDAKIVSADRLRRGGVAGFFAKQWFEIGVEVSEAEPTPTAVPDSVDALLELADQADQARFSAVLAAAEMTAAAPVATVDTVDPPEDTVDAPEDTVDAEDEPLRPALSTGRAWTRAGEAVEIAKGRAMPAPRRSPRHLPVRAQAAPAELVEVTKRLPALPGKVIVIAGELPHALEVAGVACQELRISPAAVLVAGPADPRAGHRQVCGPEHAARLAGELSAANGPTVVAVHAPVADRDGWAAGVIEALGASAVWAVVDATRKTKDLARYLAGFGQVDAIAVHGAAASADPGSVIDLGYPVATVDGQRVAADGGFAALRGATMRGE